MGVRVSCWGWDLLFGEAMVGTMKGNDGSMAHPGRHPPIHPVQPSTCSPPTHPPTHPPATDTSTSQKMVWLLLSPSMVLMPSTVVFSQVHPSTQATSKVPMFS